MADENEDFFARSACDAAAVGIAMTADAPAADAARAYLREQTRLARLQSENLIEQNAFEISHLKWRRSADRARGAAYVILMLLGLLVVAIVGAAVWSAMHDNGLVVESFSVPAGLAEQGQTGTVVAQHVLDRIVAMQAGTQSLRAASSYRNNWGEDLKVQIPDTGVSLGEAYRYLVAWLGRQTRITGEVVRGGSGFAVTARAGAAAGTTFRGNNLDALLDKAAERIFGQTQPYLYGIYLSSHGRDDESKSVLLALAQSDASASERAWAWSGLLFVENDTRVAEQYGYTAVTINPDLLLAHNNLAAVAWRLGHSEFAHREAVIGLKLLDADAGNELDRRVLGNMHSILAEEADAALGDYGNAVRELRADLAADHTVLRARSLAFLMRDLALMHDPGAARGIVIDPPPLTNRSVANRQILLTTSARGDVSIESNDWSAAKTDMAKGIEALGPRYASIQLQAPLALVEAESGDIASARALVETLPADCFPCVDAHARIETIARNWQAAGALFAQAVRQAPSLPFAYADWGAMLMAQGDCDGAIAQFALANQKGPHFADPLEMWGEALMLKNRSDLALAKFEEADKYAPNWGRLHLKWGEALLWSGDKAGAWTQFATASHLDLSAADQAALSKLRAAHD